jgi:hypothetical protein
MRLRVGSPDILGGRLWRSMGHTILFPTTQGYIVTPKRRLPDDPGSHFHVFIIGEVVTVLVLKIRNSHHWQSGIQVLERQLNRQTDAAFSGTAHTLYWIGTIGPHWRYGEKDNEAGFDSTR